MIYITVWHLWHSGMDISLVKNTLTARARSIQKTGIFAGYSFPCKDKDKLDRLYIFQNRIDSNFETVRWEKQSVWVFPKIWPIFKVHLHSSTARDHCALLHKFQPKMKVVKCMQSKCTILQAVSKNLRAFSYVFFTPTFDTCSLQCEKFPRKKHVCKAVKWLITRNR